MPDQTNSNLPFTVWDIRRSALAKSRSLCGLPNVAHITIGRKVIGGQATNQKALIFYVEEKMQVPEEASIPETIDLFAKDGTLIGEVQTDVQQSAPPETFGLRSGHVVRAFDNDLGVCALTYTKDGANFLITNAHVAINVAQGGAGGAVSILNRVDGLYYQVGNIIGASQLKTNKITTSDIAIIKVHDSYVVDHFMILDSQNDVDRIEGILTLSTHRYFYNVNGERYECMFPERSVGFTWILVDGVAVPYAEFWQLNMVSGQASKGHSGALLYRLDGNDVVACGLVFGGKAPTHIFAFPFNKMWKIAQGV